MKSNSKTALVSTVALGLVGVAPIAAAATPGVNPYVAGDMHNHNTCTDGSVQVGYTIDRAVGTGTDVTGGNNFNLDWFTLGNHGGSGNRDCRFSDASANIPGDNTTTYWSQTLGQTIDGIKVTSLKGTPNGTGTGASMWRWQNIREVEYPILDGRRSVYNNKVLVEGLEWIVPGHEHIDAAIISGQFPTAGASNADQMAYFEFQFDRADNDAIGPVNASNQPYWTGKDNVNNVGTAGHGKAVAGVHWLQNNHPLTSYAIPTHTERQGPFDPNGTKGYNIEHFRDFNNAGPTVAFGIESPGHMAQGTPSGGAGSYGSNAVGGGTYGLQGVYTAKIGGLWDGLLGEGRNSFIFVSSDWHNRGAGGAGDSFTTADFLPGEYTKLYIPYRGGHLSAQDIVDGMRSGNSYSVNGDIIGPDARVKATAGLSGVGMGETLVGPVGDLVTASLVVSVPAKNNSPYSFDNPLLLQDGIHQPLNKPSLDHIDVIVGQVTGVIPPNSPNYAVPNAAGVAGAAIVYNPTTVLKAQLLAKDAKKTVLGNGSTQYSFKINLPITAQPYYIRMRGTNIPVATPNVTDSNGNPLLDVNNALVACTDPACPAHLDVVGGQKMVSRDVQAYSNVWFYTNPIFVRSTTTPKLLVEKNADLAQSLAPTPGLASK